jgi:DNA polymerase-3 subunit epsilon
MFRSRRAATEALRTLADTHQLCHVLLGLQKGSGPCFAYQLRKCRGACAGKESPATHALRLAAAFVSLRLRTWPYPGAIGVREQSADGSRCDLHVLDRWCHLGTVKDEADLRALQEDLPQPLFDLDTYHILSRYLLRDRATDVIPLGTITRPAA